MSTSIEMKNKMFSIFVRILRKGGVVINGPQLDSIRQDLNEFIETMINLIKYETLATMVTTDLDKLKKEVKKPTKKESKNEDSSSN